MANFWYTSALTAILKGDVDLEVDDIRVVLATSSHVALRDTHDFLDDISAGHRVATSVNLSGKAVASGAFDATDYTFTALTGSAFSQIILYKHTGTESTSQLLVHIDQASNLPFTPTGANHTLAWATAGIAKLGHTA